MNFRSAEGTRFDNDWLAKKLEFIRDNPPRSELTGGPLASWIDVADVLGEFLARVVHLEAEVRRLEREKKPWSQDR